jgi:hypothetical protein
LKLSTIIVFGRFGLSVTVFEALAYVVIFLFEATGDRF